ncbi:MAG: virulence factor [Kangiellaceae bacterium]
MAKLTTTYWRDIPAQVVASERRKKAKVLLSNRFAEAIDKAAMRANMAGSDAYLEQWRKEITKCSDDLELEVEKASKKLETDFSDERLALLVTNKGLI